MYGDVINVTLAMGNKLALITKMGNVYYKKEAVVGRRALDRIIAVNVISVKLTAFPLM